ncbi:unnamed protein product, partial [Hapterophycus canaliculatus]
LGGATQVVDLVGSTLFATGTVNIEGLEIFDVSDPTDIRRLGGITSPGAQFTQVDAVGSLAFFTGGTNGLLSIDVSDPVNPTILDQISIPGLNGSATDVEVLGAVAFVSTTADGSGGLVAFDVSNPS